MLGYVAYGDGPARPQVQRRNIAGGGFLAVSLRRSRRPGNPAARWRAVSAAGKLRAQGVRQAVFPVDFPYLSLFIRQGICPVDTLPAQQALAAPLVRRRLEELGLGPTQAVAAVSTERMSRVVAETVKALALSYRYVLLSAREGEEDFARSLRREYGVSLLLRPTVEQLDRADALVLFAPRGDLAGSNPIFYTLYPGGERERGQVPLALPAAIEEQLEPNCDRGQMAAALHAMGALSLETLLGEIVVDRTEKYLYNAKTII